MLEEKIELIGGVEVEQDVKKKMVNVGIKGFDVEKAKELGLFQRISFLLCAMHSTIIAAYRIYGGVDLWISRLNARKFGIGQEMAAFEKAVNRFFRFWTDFYAQGEDVNRDVNVESENLYRNIMKWAQLPLTWELGEPQNLEDNTDIVIKVPCEDGRNLNFYRCVTDTEIVEEPKESWCVTKYDVATQKQTTINTDMDKGSAVMVAKRLSEEDKENIYAANLVRDIVEKRIEVLPFKAFKANETVGKVKEYFNKI